MGDGLIRVLTSEIHGDWGIHVQFPPVWTMLASFE